MTTENKLTSFNKGNAVRIIFAALFVLMVAISIGVYGAPTGQMLVLLMFFVFYVQLPGMLIVKSLNAEKGHLSTFLALGLFAGWAFIILLYFITDLLENNILMMAFGPLMSLAYLFTVVKERRDGRNPLKRFKWSKISIAFCIFAFLILLYCLTETQYQYMSPEIADFTTLNSDKAYHMGLINSLSHDYPLQSPWISGVIINYHIFSEMLLSVPVRLFGVESDVVTQSFGPFLTTYCFGISLYSFFVEMSAKSKSAGIYCLLVILANIYATRSITTSIAYKFVLTNDNSSGYGMAAAFMTIVAFNKWYKAFEAKERNRYGLLILTAALVMLTTGIKGPMGAVALLGIWGTMVLGVILRKVSPKVILPLIVITAGFLLVYTFILGSKGQSNASGSSIFAFAKIVDIAFWKKPLVKAMKAIGIPRIFRYGVLLFVFMLFFLSIFFVPFCIGYIRELILVLRGRKDFEPAKVLVYAECAVGLIAMFLLNYSGHSQIYFGLVSAFLAPMVAFWFLEDMEAKYKTSTRADTVLGTCVVIMAATLVLTSGAFMSYLFGNIAESIAETKTHVGESKYLSVSRDEYEAMEWIEDNTEEDALLATDRYYSVDPKTYSYKNRWDNRFFLYGVYSNRFSYIGGSGYNMREADWPKRKEMIETNLKLYDPNFEGRGDLARELDVDYVIVSKRFTDVPDLSNKDYELCYSNDDIDIYKIAG